MSPRRSPTAPPERQPVLKTLKMYVGGKFIRSESGRVTSIASSRGEPMYVPQASRKDLRDAIAIAREAQQGWAARTAYNRGQILYRLAETLEDRLDSLPAVDGPAAVDRVVHHAGWADKITALLSSLNPVASGHVNYSMVTATGVFVAVPAADDGLLGMVEALCAVTLMGNTVLLAVPDARAELGVALAEALAVSDVPAGVMNILTGDVSALLGTADIHDDLDGLYVTEDALATDRLTASQQAAARVMRRVVVAPRAASPASPSLLGRLAEVRTVWMSS